MTLRNVALVAGLALGLVPGTSKAATLLTSAAGYTGPILDIGAYSNTFILTAGPITFSNGITYSSTDASSVVGTLGYSLGSNGSVYDALIGTNTGYAVITLMFPTAVSAFGGYFNYGLDAGQPAGNDPTITALNAAGDVIASYDLFTDAPISTPNGFNQYAFRGISDTTADIAAFQLSGSYIIQQSVSAVPLPASAPMFGAAVLALGLAGYGLKRKKAAATV